jgi:IclR family acetate operon transcriptional repressor
VTTSDRSSLKLSRAEGSSESPGLLLTLTRGLAALDTIARSGGNLTSAEISRAIGVKRATGYQILRTLRARGYVRRMPGGGHRLGERVNVLVEAMERQSSPPGVVIDLLDQLHALIDETVYATWFDGSEIVLSAEREGRRHLRVGGLQVGYLGSIHARASCKAVLAFLPMEEVRSMLARQGLPKCGPNTITSWRELRANLLETRSRGHALDYEEFTEGICCVGVPFFDSTGRPTGSFAIAVPSSRFDDVLRRPLSHLKAIAVRASLQLGFEDPRTDDPENRVVIRR